MVLQFFLGFLASFVAATPPGLLNLTSLKISLEKGKEKSYYFAFGVSIIIFIQAYFSLIFTNYIHSTSNIETSLQFIGFILFSLLSFYFFYKGIKEKQTQKIKKSKIKNSFTLGLILSSLNLLAIPYYCSVGSALNSYGLLDFTQISILIFVFGSSIGTFALLSIYNNSAKIIQKKIGLLSRNFNVILGIITGIIAFIALIKIIN